jgi:hypothetical protein
MEVLEEQKRGRPALISKEKLYEIRAWAVAQDKKQSSSTRSKLNDKILEIMRAQAEETTGRPDVVQLPSKSTLEAIHKFVTPVKVRTPSTQNMRRWMVAQDLRTVLTMAAVAGVVFDLRDPRNRAETIFNSDITSLLLGVDKQAVYVAEGTVDMLAAECKGVCRTVDAVQQRGISLMASTSADGSLVSVIVILKDNNIKTFTQTKVYVLEMRQRVSPSLSFSFSSIVSNTNSPLPSCIIAACHQDCTNLLISCPQ